MALENLTPAVRIEEILDGQNIEPVTRLEYFLKQASNEVPKATAANTGKVLMSTLDADNNPVITWEEPSGGGSALWDFEVAITQTVDDTSGDNVYTASLSVADYIAIQEALFESGVVWGKCLLHFIDVDGITHNHICQYTQKYGGVPVSLRAYAVLVEDIYQLTGVPTVDEYEVDENGVTRSSYNLEADMSTGEITWSPPVA